MSDQVIGYVEGNPHISTRALAKETNQARSTIQNILHDHGYVPYKARKVHFMNAGADHYNRLAFAQAMTERMNSDEHFLRRVLFSDESLFVLRDSFNTQNKRYWASENPHWYVESKARALRGEQVMIWAGILDEHIIGPYFF